MKKKRILFVDRSTKLDTIYDLEHRPRGGMVSSLLTISDYLAYRGHDVTVLSDIASDGITNYGAKWLNETWGDYDCLILNRGIGDGYPQINAKARILWTHDLVHSGFIPEPRNIRAFAATVFMSRYSEATWRTFYRDIGKSVLIPNGVDKNHFFPEEKDPDLFVYASAPDRGLERLPFLLDCVRARTRDTVRFVAYSNMQVLHPNEVDSGFDYQSVSESAVELNDPIPQVQLAAKLRQASGLLMPTQMPETCSNNTLQALSCGTPVFGTGGLGSIGEWVKHRGNGMLTTYQPADYMVYIAEMVRNLTEYVRDRNLQIQLQAGAAKTKILSWEEVGDRWHKLIRRVC